jgi:hypothetical protein
MMGKGATYEEAKRLTELKKQEEQNKTNGNQIQQDQEKNSKTNTKSNDDDDENDDENNDEKFLQKHRQKRIIQLQNEKYGTVIPIQRNEWNHQVNDTSQDGTWVIITLTSQKSSPNLHPFHKDLCLSIEDYIIPQLARQYKAIKFVSIPSTSAIENWPENNLPTLFCYRYGKLQCQLVGLEEFGIKTSTSSITSGISFKMVEWRLGKLGVLDVVDLDLDEYEDDEMDHINNRSTRSTSGHGRKKNKSLRHGNSNGNGKGYGRSHFGGGMAQLQTGNCTNDDNDESDYDDVD